jgi:hypothetical protein
VGPEIDVELAPLPKVGLSVGRFHWLRPTANRLTYGPWQMAVRHEFSGLVTPPFVLSFESRIGLNFRVNPSST